MTTLDTCGMQRCRVASRGFLLVDEGTFADDDRRQREAQLSRERAEELSRELGVEVPETPDLVAPTRPKVDF